MSVAITVNGTTFNYPTDNDPAGWGTPATNAVVALSNSTLQLNAGAFSITNELNFGANFGVKSLYFSSRSNNPATTGAFRLASTDNIVWRNSTNTSDISLGLLNDRPAFGGSAFVTENSTDTLINKTISADSNTITDIDTGEFKAGVIVTSIGAGAADTEIPTAQAVLEERTNATTLANKTLTAPIINDGVLNEVASVDDINTLIITDTLAPNNNNSIDLDCNNNFTRVEIPFPPPTATVINLNLTNLTLGRETRVEIVNNGTASKNIQFGFTTSGNGVVFGTSLVAANGGATTTYRIQSSTADNQSVPQPIIIAENPGARGARIVTVAAANEVVNIDAFDFLNPIRINSAFNYTLTSSLINNSANLVLTNSTSSTPITITASGFRINDNVSFVLGGGNDAILQVDDLDTFVVGFARTIV